jgi:hypothetical protein
VTFVKILPDITNGFPPPDRCPGCGQPRDPDNEAARLVWLRSEHHVIHENIIRYTCGASYCVATRTGGLWGETWTSERFCTRPRISSILRSAREQPDIPQDLDDLLSVAIDLAVSAGR